MTDFSHGYEPANNASIEASKSAEVTTMSSAQNLISPATSELITIASVSSTQQSGGELLINAFHDTISGTVAQAVTTASITPYQTVTIKTKAMPKSFHKNTLIKTTRESGNFLLCNFHMSETSNGFVLEIFAL